MPTLVSYELSDSVATITMDDGKVNALSPTMLSELDVALGRAEADGAVVVLTGRPGVFSAGFDLGVLLSGGDAGPGLLRAGMETALRMLSFPTPVVVACSGHAVAMGMFLLLAGDYRLGVTGEFRIGANEVSIGMTMTATAVEVSRQRLSPPYLGRVLDNAEMFGPDDAVAAGILDRVVAAEALRAAALDAARQLASLDMGAHALTKRLVRAPALVSMSAAIEADDAAFRAVLRAGVGPPAGQGVPGLDRSERAFE